VKSNPSIRPSVHPSIQVSIPHEGFHHQVVADVHLLALRSGFTLSARFNPFPPPPFPSRSGINEIHQLIQSFISLDTSPSSLNDGLRGRKEPGGSGSTPFTDTSSKWRILANGARRPEMSSRNWENSRKIPVSSGKLDGVQYDQVEPNSDKVKFCFGFNQIQSVLVRLSPELTGGSLTRQSS